MNSASLIELGRSLERVDLMRRLLDHIESKSLDRHTLSVLITEIAERSHEARAARNKTEAA